MIAKSLVTDMESASPHPADHRPVGERANGYRACGYDASIGSFAIPGAGAHHRPANRNPPPRRPPLDRDQRVPLLAGLIASRVVPRLVLAHRPDRDGARRPGGWRRIGPHDVLVLGEFVLKGEFDSALGHLEALIERGLPPEAIYLDLLMPAAARLGDLWCEDRLSFAEVTIGQVTLQRLQRAFSGIFLRDCPQPNPRRRILLSPLPGEQHAFGHLMVCDFFRRAGWQVTAEQFATRAALVATVHENWFEVIGISLSCAERMQELSLLIRALRGASRNGAMAVLVGGAPFNGRPSLAWQVGADATAVDAGEAPARAEALVGMLQASA